MVYNIYGYNKYKRIFLNIFILYFFFNQKSDLFYYVKVKNMGHARDRKEKPQNFFSESKSGCVTASLRGVWEFSSNTHWETFFLSKSLKSMFLEVSPWVFDKNSQKYTYRRSDTSGFRFWKKFPEGVSYRSLAWLNHFIFHLLLICICLFLSGSYKRKNEISKWA